MKRIMVRIKGTTPLLQHRMTEEELHGLLGSKSAKKKDKEQLTPRQIAEKYAYKNALGFVIPTAYLVGAFKNVASEYKQKNSQRKSIKSIAAGIFRPEEEYAQLLNEDGSPITNFEVDIRKATNHQKGAIAVCRPRFDKWYLDLVIVIDEELVNEDTVLAILNDAGKRSGIGSFRVAKGGYFGQFVVTEFQKLEEELRQAA
jgi:hypothetical protein